MPADLSTLEQTRLPFGKHKGKTFDGTPLKYLDWLRGQEWFRDKFSDLHDKLAAYLEHPTIRYELERELEED